MDFSNKKWQQLQEEKKRLDEEKIAKEKEEAIRRGKNRLQPPSFKDARNKNYGKSTSRQRENTQAKSQYNSQDKSVLTSSVDSAGNKNITKPQNISSINTYENTKNIPHKEGGFIPYNKSRNVPQNNANTSLRGILQDKLQNAEKNKPGKFVKQVNKEVSFAEIKQGALQVPLLQLVDLINSKNEGKLDSRKQSNKKKHGKFPEDEVAALLRRLKYLSDHYVLSSELKAEFQNVADNIKDADQRLEVKQRIAMMQDISTCDNKTRTKPIIYNFPIEHNVNGFKWRKSSDGGKGKHMTLVAKNKNEFMSKLRLSIVKAYQHNNSKKLLSRRKSMKQEAKKSRKSKVEFPSMLYERMPKFNSKSKSLKKYEPLNEGNRSPRFKHSYFDSDGARSNMWKLSQVPEINISKYSSYNNEPTMLFKLDSPSVKMVIPTISISQDTSTPPNSRVNNNKYIDIFRQTGVLPVPIMYNNGEKNKRRELKKVNYKENGATTNNVKEMSSIDLAKIYSHTARDEIINYNYISENCIKIDPKTSAINKHEDLRERLQLFEDMRLGRISRQWGTEWKVDTSYTRSNFSKISHAPDANASYGALLPNGDRMVSISPSAPSSMQPHFFNYNDTTRSRITEAVESDVKRELNSFKHHCNMVYKSEMCLATYKNDAEVNESKYILPKRLNEVDKDGQLLPWPSRSIVTQVKAVLMPSSNVIGECTPTNVESHKTPTIVELPSAEVEDKIRSVAWNPLFTKPEKGEDSSPNANSTQISGEEVTSDHDHTKSDWLVFDTDSNEARNKLQLNRHTNTPISTVANTPNQILSIIDYGERSMLDYFDSILLKETDMSNVRRKVVDAIHSEIKISNQNRELIEEYGINSRELKVKSKTRNRRKKSSIKKTNISQLKKTMQVVDTQPLEGDAGVSPEIKEVNDPISVKKTIEDTNTQTNNIDKQPSDDFQLILNYDGLTSDRMPGESISDDSISSGLSRLLIPGSPILHKQFNKWGKNMINHFYTKDIDIQQSMNYVYTNFPIKNKIMNSPDKKLKKIKHIKVNDKLKRPKCEVHFMDLRLFDKLIFETDKVYKDIKQPDWFCNNIDSYFVNLFHKFYLYAHVCHKLNCNLNEDIVFQLAKNIDCEIKYCDIENIMAGLYRKGEYNLFELLFEIGNIKNHKDKNKYSKRQKLFNSMILKYTLLKKRKTLNPYDLFTVDIDDIADLDERRTRIINLQKLNIKSSKISPYSDGKWLQRVTKKNFKSTHPEEEWENNVKEEHCKRPRICAKYETPDLAKELKEVRVAQNVDRLQKMREKALREKANGNSKTEIQEKVIEESEVDVNDITPRVRQQIKEIDPTQLRSVKSILPFTLHKFSKHKRIVMHDYTRLEQIKKTNMQLKQVSPEFGVANHRMQMGIKMPKLKTFKQNAANDIQQIREITGAKMEAYTEEIKSKFVDKSHKKWNEVTPEAMYSPFLRNNFKSCFRCFAPTNEQSTLLSTVNYNLSVSAQMQKRLPKNITLLPPLPKSRNKIYECNREKWQDT